jgi:hypothetical protein
MKFNKAEFLREGGELEKLVIQDIEDWAFKNGSLNSKRHTSGLGSVEYTFAMAIIHNFWLEKGYKYNAIN